MNYRTNLLRNDNKKLKERELLLINTNPHAKSYIDLETEKNEVQLEVQQLTNFFNECGFTDYTQTRKLLNGKTVPELIDELKKQTETINDFQQILKDKDQDWEAKKKEVIKGYEVKLLQKEQAHKNNIKHYVEKWHKKARPSKATIGTQTDLKEQQVQTFINQWNQVAEWAKESGININKKWNLESLKKVIGKEKALLEKDNEDLKEENLEVKSKNLLLAQEIDREKNNNQPLKEKVKKQKKKLEISNNLITSLKEDIKKEKAEWQGELRKINILFDEQAQNYETIDFNGLYSLLSSIAERERERERDDNSSKWWWQKKKEEKK